MRLLMWTGFGVAFVALLFAAFLFAFLGFVVHGVFFVFEAALAGGVAGIACWWLREWSRADEAADETQLLAVEAIAEHTPAPRRRTMPVHRWRRACGRAAHHIRGSAERDAGDDVEQLRRYRERQRRDAGVSS